MATKKTTKKRSTKPQDGYTVFLNINNEDYSSTADTLNEALLNLPQVTPKTVAKLIVAKGDKRSRPITLFIPNYRRLFYPGLTGEIQRTNFIKRYSVLS